MSTNTMHGSDSLDNNCDDRIIQYCISGGFQDYLSWVDDKLSSRENMRDLYFYASRRLFEEPTNPLK